MGFLPLLETNSLNGKRPRELAPFDLIGVYSSVATYLEVIYAACFGVGYPDPPQPAFSQATKYHSSSHIVLSRVAANCSSFAFCRAYGSSGRWAPV